MVLAWWFLTCTVSLSRLFQRVVVRCYTRLKIPGCCWTYAATTGRCRQYVTASAKNAPKLNGLIIHRNSESLLWKFPDPFRSLRLAVLQFCWPPKKAIADYSLDFLEGFQKFKFYI